MENSKISLRFSLSSAFVLIVLLTSVVLGVVIYYSVRIELRESLRQRLGDVAAATSLNIQAAEHAALRTPEDMESPAYLKYREQFFRLRAMNQDIGFLYTLRITENDEFEFVLDSGQTEEEFSPLGMIYEDVTPTMKAAFQKPYQVHVESDFYTDQWGTWLSSFAPIVNGEGELEAILGLDISAAQVSAYEWGLLVLIVSICIVVSSMGAWGGIWFSRGISKPLLGLSKDMGKIQQFILDDDETVHSRIREVNVMAESLLNMKKGLRSFKKYVPSDVVAQLISMNKEAILETSKVPLTIFFSDLENFTNFSESLPPEKLAEVLSGYFHAMTSTLQDHRATVDKFIGDSVMAFWNAPLPLEDHAFWACKAALECQAALEQISTEWVKIGLPAVKTRMGINSGNSVVGNVGFAQRLSYTALGDAVNLASRLESLNKYYGTSILIGEETYLAVKGRMKVRMVDKVAVKGKSLASGVYELLSGGELSENLQASLEIYNKGLESYFKRDWIGAQTHFESVLETLPGDGPSRLLLTKTRGFMKNPPAPDWDGGTVMHEK